MFKVGGLDISLKFLFAVLISNFLLSLHFALIIYINSTFLEQFFSAGELSFLFTLGAILNLAILISGSKLINRFGNYRLTLFFIFLEFLAVLGLALFKSPIFVAALFVLHQGVVMAILFFLDIFLESYSGNNESRTGSIRAIYLTLGNTAFMLAPATAGLILSENNFFRIYLVSALLLIPLFFLVKFGLKRKVINIEKIRPTKFSLSILKNKNIRGVFAAQFILQFFFAWMVIYMPLHLSQNVGFSWTEIGLIFTIMLLPFIIFELPLGRIADSKLGEKEIMTIGFFIMALSTALIPFVKEAIFIIWATTLFMTRVGASFVEISSESYFFKHVDSENTDIISFFRITRPLALIVAPIIGAGVLWGLDIFNIGSGFLFLVLAISTLYGIKHSLNITDTK